jgi:hypothetical protein
VNVHYFVNRNSRVTALEYFGNFIDCLKFRFQLSEVFSAHKISFVDYKNISEGNLLDSFIFHPFGFLFPQVLLTVFGVHKSDNCVKSEQGNNILVHKKRLGDGAWISKSSSLNDHGIKLVNSLRDKTLQTFDQIVPNCAANTAVEHFDYFLVCLKNKSVVYPDLPKLVFDYCDSHSMVFFEHVVYKSCFARPEKPG